MHLYTPMHSLQVYKFVRIFYKKIVLLIRRKRQGKKKYQNTHIRMLERNAKIWTFSSKLTRILYFVSWRVCIRICTRTLVALCVLCPSTQTFHLLVLCETGLLDGIGIELLCYVVLLMMPVLGRMSDQEREVRLMASRCFASLVTLMPLEVSE